MEIRFSPLEIEKIRNYFNRGDAGETPKQLSGLAQDFPEWHTVFLLLRKLLAYGIHHSAPADPEISYEELQKKSQKPDSMWATVHTHLDQFKDLVAQYTMHHAA